MSDLTEFPLTRRTICMEVEVEFRDSPETQPHAGNVIVSLPEGVRHVRTRSSIVTRDSVLDETTGEWRDGRDWR